MKYSFENSGRHRANAWLDEEPPGALTGSSVETELVRPRCAISAMRRVAGVELQVSHGPRSSYALLGAELIQADVEGLEVMISTTKIGAPFPVSIARELDEVKVGLPAEYVRAVVDGAAEVAMTKGAPTNQKLWFRWAAHGFVSSSPVIFEKASGIVLRLLMLPTVDTDEIRSILGL